MMKEVLTTAIAFVVFFSIPVVAQNHSSSSAVAGSICITFDDLPVAQIADRIERLKITEDILEALDELNISATGFVVGSEIGSDKDILISWLEAGHTLGNLTYSCPDLNELPPEFFIGDIEKGGNAIENLLIKFGQKKRYFRYPYLHYGNDPKTKKVVADYLYRNGYKVGHVTVNSDDFAYNLQYEKVRQGSDSLEQVRLGNEYIDHVIGQLENAEKRADEIVGHPIRQILLLHVNRLNSVYLPDLLSEIKLRGYSFISMGKALADPIYSESETYVGPKGLSYLERIDTANADFLPAREK